MDSGPSPRAGARLGRRRGAIVAIVMAVGIAVVAGLLIVADDDSGSPSTTSSRAAGGTGPVRWTHLTTDGGDLPAPTEDGAWQMALVVLDADDDGDDDFVVATAEGDPSVDDGTIVLYRRSERGWDTEVVERGQVSVEAGGAVHDIDGDGDLDVAFGEDRRGSRVFWWENPHPRAHDGSGWARHVIKDSGPVKHHDMAFGDVDGDGSDEFLVWNQGRGNRVNRLLLGDVPEDPRSGPWDLEPIHESGDFSEGLDLADVDGDGVEDVVGGGVWLRHSGGGAFEAESLRPDRSAGRYRAAQLVEEGRPEILVGSGDLEGPLEWLSWTGGRWEATQVGGGTWRFGHSLDVGDVDDDGNLDVFAAEMHRGAGDEARAVVFYGDGAGHFTPQEISVGVDHHESKLADVDGDGDLDIVGKPWRTGIPGVHVWLNEGRTPRGEAAAPDGGEDRGGKRSSVAGWRKHVIDAERPARAVFVRAGDLDGDGDLDLVAGGVWYRNPGTLGGRWDRVQIGAPFHNVAVVHDFDGDGDLDLLGTQGVGSEPDARLVWARNERARFRVFAGVATGRGDFLQGAVVERLEEAGPLEVVLSWHDAEVGLEVLTVPEDPAAGRWRIRRLSTVSLGEEVAPGDVDGDGDVDLVLGTAWLRNSGSRWRPFVLHRPDQGGPDRVKLADVDGDGDLDVVVGYEKDPEGTVAWYEAPDDPRRPWEEHVIANVTSPHSLDVGDVDGDGDLDVVIGEHTPRDPDGGRAFVAENGDGTGADWRIVAIDSGEDHHDGMQLADLDGDGDLDAFSIGWDNPRVLVYERVAS